MIALTLSLLQTIIGVTLSHGSPPVALEMAKYKKYKCGVESI